VTAQLWVYFLLAVSVLLLVTTSFFARQVAGSVVQGAGAFFKRQYKTVAALLMLGFS